MSTSAHHVRAAGIGSLLLALSLTAGLSQTSATAAAPSDPPSTGRVAALHTAPPGKAVAGMYIVSLAPQSDARGSASRHAVAPRLVFGEGTRTPAYAARLTPGQLEQVRRDPQTLEVQESQVLSTASTQRLPDGGQWGLDRIDQRRLPLSKSFYYAGTASNVTAYVVDTGIDYSHREFGGRAAKHFDAFGGTGADCHGHGTHVAGIIGSRTYGVAKSVRLRSVRVLDCGGYGTDVNIIAGLDSIRRSHAAKSVANVSIGGGGDNPALDRALGDLYNSGVAVVVAAGNDGKDACAGAIAGAPGTVTVAASNRLDQHAWFSNFGPCVDLYAPGLGVRSTSLNNSTEAGSGTSIASPFVAGALALKLSSGPYSAGGVRAWVLSNASKNLISGNPSGTPDLLLNKTPL